MLKYAAVRVASIVPLLFVTLLIVFTLGKLAPGDPIELMYMQPATEGERLTRDQIAEQRRRYGLDRPAWIQFADYVGRTLRGDLGTSITQNRPVLPMILRVFPISAQMGLLAMALLAAVAIPMGILAALKQNTAVDYLIVGGSLFLQTVPVYVLAPLLLLLLVLQLDVIDVPRGWQGLFSTNVILPVLLLMLYPLAVVVRQMRAALLDVLTNDYVRTARAKGLKEPRVIAGHVLRNALAPVATQLGLIVTGLVSGSLFLDVIFGIPGFGQLSVNALNQRDYPLIMGCTLFGAFLVMVSNLIVDLIYPLLDPRVKL